MSRAGRVLAVLVVLALAAGAAFLLIRGRTSGPTVEVTPAKKATISQSVSAGGKIESRKQGTVVAPFSGTIVDLPVKDGRTVENDDVVATIEETPSPPLNTSRKKKIRATRGGRLLYERIQLVQGQPAKATAVGLTVAQGQTLFSIVDFKSVVFVAAVDESDITRIRRKQEVRLELDAYPGRSFSGRVGRVGLTSTTTQSGGTAFEVFIDLRRPKGVALRLGMNGSADILEQTRKDSLVVPIDAIQGAQDRQFVYVVSTDDEIVRRPVETGIQTDTDAEILGGLTEGERVVVSNPSELAPGDKVTVRTRP